MSCKSGGYYENECYVNRDGAVVRHQDTAFGEDMILFRSNVNAGTFALGEREKFSRFLQLAERSIREAAGRICRFDGKTCSVTLTRVL